MKDRSISLDGDEVRSVLAGTKTVFRRLARNRKHPDYGCDMTPCELSREEGHVIARACPYGQPGDRLYVRETWSCEEEIAGTYEDVLFRATDQHLESILLQHGVKVFWRSSACMPRRYSRIVIEVTGVRIERLQSISEDDARSEGAEWHDGHGTGHSGWRHDHKDVHEDARSSFARLWNETNGPIVSFEKNPWVWVIEFSRVAP